MILLGQDLGAFGEFTVRFPDRHCDLGISEENLVGAAAGMAHIGMRPFVLAMKPFLTMWTVHIGRVGITVDALPIILPVNFVLVDERVLFRTSAGAKPDVATPESVVAFGADAYSPDGAAGWSVLVAGRSRHVDNDERVAALAESDFPKGGHQLDVPITSLRLRPRT